MITVKKVLPPPPPEPTHYHVQIDVVLSREEYDCLIDGIGRTQGTSTMLELYQELVGKR